MSAALKAALVFWRPKSAYYPKSVRRGLLLYGVVFSVVMWAARRIWKRMRRAGT